MDAGVYTCTSAIRALLYHITVGNVGCPPLSRVGIPELYGVVLAAGHKAEGAMDTMIYHTMHMYEVS